MVHHNIGLSSFPAVFRRTVATWYEWQGLYLWSRGRRPGEVPRAAAKWETADQVFWGARPPTLLADGIFEFNNPAGDIRFSVVKESGVFYLDVEERGSLERCCMFREFEVLEKYLLLTISENARPGNYLESPRLRWRDKGPEPRAILTQPDPDNFPGRLSITIIGEVFERCWMGRGDAIAFTHGIVMSYDDLNKLVREGIPSAAFQVEVAIPVDEAPTLSRYAGPEQG